MNRMNWDAMNAIANICVSHMKGNLTPFPHIKNRAHFGTPEEVMERMANERKRACSSFLGYLTEERLIKIVEEQLAYDIEYAEFEKSSFNRSTGRDKYAGALVMNPLDPETDDRMDTGFIIYYDSFDRTYSRPLKCHRIMICVSWETYDDGSVCEPTFCIESIFPIK